MTTAASGFRVRDFPSEPNRSERKRGRSGVAVAPFVRNVCAQKPCTCLIFWVFKNICVPFAMYQIPEEIVVHTFAHISEHRCLARCCRVSRRWSNLAAKDSLWRSLCIQLWSDKVHVAERFRLLLGAGRSQEAMKESLRDSRRSLITLEEFSGLTFHFRFKKAAGQFWTDRDPFWQNDKALCMHFRQDGPIADFPQMKWRLVDREEESCEERGSFIYVMLEDTCAAIYAVSRHSNWGFIIQVSSRPLLPSRCSCHQLTRSMRCPEPMGCLRLIPPQSRRQPRRPVRPASPTSANLVHPHTRPTPQIAGRDAPPGHGCADAATAAGPAVTLSNSTHPHGRHYGRRPTLPVASPLRCPTAPPLRSHGVVARPFSGKRRCLAPGPTWLDVGRGPGREVSSSGRLERLRAISANRPDLRVTGGVSRATAGAGRAAAVPSRRLLSSAPQCGRIRAPDRLPLQVPARTRPSQLEPSEPHSQLGGDHAALVRSGGSRLGRQDSPRLRVTAAP